MTLPFPGFLFMGAAVGLFVFAFGREVAQRRTGAVEMVVAPAPGDAGRLFGPLVWIVLQIPIVVFSYRSREALSRTVP